MYFNLNIILEKTFVNSTMILIFEPMKNNTVHTWWWSNLRQNVVK